ncbi:YadA C-terminal domain-containing protein [Citrobacter sp. ku-bf4]|uniref:YadA C-terminal domain-containing protein n=1 Tax=Citrobacter TaxID=544 RepID=UPI00197D6CE6|nr:MULTISPECIES: YadA C-terminal domain-containing protein [Citrobacter]MBN6046086.1 YadA C-terminal domain-containing protein [Citrobacter sp. ku-bf4]MBS0827602.1 YadA C-terminal domain-containing protein [Citrobacter amalonaticus]
MKSVNKSIIAVAVFSALFASLAPAAQAANVEAVVTNPTTQGAFFVSGIDGATYDLQKHEGQISALEAGKADVTQVNNVAAYAQQIRTDHDNLVQRVTLDEQYDGQAIIKNRDDIATNKANQKIVDNDQNVLISTNGSKADTALQHAATNQIAVTNVQTKQKAQDGVIQTHTTQLANHETRITTLENQNNSRFSSMEKQQNDDRKEYRSGIAGAASIAGLHYVDTDNAIAVGAADFKSEQGYAMGYRHKFAENVAATVSYAGTSDGDSVVAASASLGW